MLKVRVRVLGADFLGNALQHLNHFGVLLLGQQVDLQVQLVSAVADAQFIVLADKDEG
jgi:hypothetical protein